METVCLLSKLKSGHRVEVEFKLDRIELIAAEKKRHMKKLRIMY